jgi:hypothetical protein
LRAAHEADDTVGDRFMFQSFSPDKTPEQVAQGFGTKFAAAQTVAPLPLRVLRHASSY